MLLWLLQALLEEVRRTLRANLFNLAPELRWQDPTDKTMFALARLDLEKFKAALDQANQLDGKVRDFVRANSDKAFADLDSAVKAKTGN